MMSVPELVQRVRETRETNVDAFESRVADEVETLKEELRNGTFDNPQAIVGLEYEFYGAHHDTDALMRVPRRLLEHIGFEKELGLHNAEMHTSPQPFNRFGLASQETEVQARLNAALRETRTEDIRLVSDGLWTVPPTGESAAEYLGDSVDYDGIRIGTNMSKSVRYHGIANTAYPVARRVETPHVDFETDTVTTESLTASIQPHYQVPHALDFPTYHRYAVRVAGPVLALAVNSPFLPPDLYDEVDAERILADHWMETRIPVFEGVLNPRDGPDKVRFPRDVDTVVEAVDLIAEDPVIVPLDVDPAERFDDAFRHLMLKRQSFWRWIRPVFGGATPSEANLRIEFRPLPAQPTVRDSVAFLALFAGLLEGMVTRDHPAVTLDWETAKENFYGAMRDGLDANLEWITRSGTETNDTTAIFADLFESARDGLTMRGLTAPAADAYLRPLEGRVNHRITPARWKHGRVRERIAAGDSLEEAIRGMQSAYIARQQDTLITGSFLDWLSGPRAT